MSSRPPSDFYDFLAPRYHLIASDWQAAVRRQGSVLDTLLAERLETSERLRVLDCSCGIGTQAIGLALHGHVVVGLDLSSKAIERARQEANRFDGLDDPPEFMMGDMRNLDAVDGTFDVVVSLDNAFAHLHDDADLDAALDSMRSVVCPDGLLLISIRNYDALDEPFPSGTMPRRIDDDHGERIYVQTWDWSDDHRHYDMELFLIRRTDDGWSATSSTTRMRAYCRRELTPAVEQHGFTDVEWLMPSETDYYQPILAGFLA